MGCSKSLSALAITLLVSALPSTCVADPLFKPVVNYATGVDAVGLAVADLNGDGVPDLVLANNANGSPGAAVVLLGKGDGSFESPVAYAAGLAPTSVAVGDFNNDGRPDVVVTNDYGASVSVLLGNGDGTLQAAVNYSVGSFPFQVVVADFNKDGKPDLAVTNTEGGQGNGGSVSILLGNGDGTFQPAVSYTAGKGPFYVASGDFNNDGYSDLVLTSNHTNAVTMLLNNGDGTFGPPLTLVKGGGPTEIEFVAVADVNNDGNADIFVSQLSKLNIVELLGNGDGTFQRKNLATTLPPFYMAFGDFNGDGKVDLAVTGGGVESYITVLLGTSTGKFQQPVNFPVLPELGPIAIADLNQDGKLDIVDANIEGVEVLLNQAAPSVSLPTTSLVFGTQLDGTISTAQSVKLTNNGYATLNFSSITVSGEFKERDGCGASLTQGASCNISVAFAPTGPGTKLGTVTITDDAGDSPQTISLNGQGTAFSLTPASLNFGNQKVGTTSQPQTVTLSAVGNGSMAIQGISIFGDFAQTNNCGTTLAGGSSCTITVTFTPSVAGARNGTLEVDGGGGSPRLTTLTGNGI